MASLRPLIGLAFLAGCLHLLGISREPLPAQDGLKFVRVAKLFQTLPWREAVRKSDQHPLYPALVAITEPVVRVVVGSGPTTWRLSMQLVSMFASLAFLVPFFGLARTLFDERTATLSVFLFLILPLPTELGHETLSDMTALLAFIIAFRLGEYALRTSDARAAIACGFVSGAGYLARPEVAAVPIVVLITAGLSWRPAAAWDRTASLRWAGLSISLLIMIGSYAIVKGEVSEKLALRLGVGLSPSAPPKLATAALPTGLDQPGVNFDAKEEEDEGLRNAPLLVTASLLYRWAGTLGFILVPLAGYGIWRGEASNAKKLVAVYFIFFSMLVIKHSLTLGYLSGRHTLTLVILTIPWSAAGYITMTRDLAEWIGWDPAGVSRRRACCAALALVVGITIQVAKPGHPSRWGHLAAGRWLIENTSADDQVLDTRGWAKFVSDRQGYDYWHVKQALQDKKLAYVVVGNDELESESDRARTLRAILAYAAEPVAAFPSRFGGHDKSVKIFRFHPPETWEGLTL